MDTAQLYAQGRNEAETGKLLEGIPREQCFLTSKLSQKGDNNDQPVPIDQIRQSVMDSIAKLGRKPECASLLVFPFTLQQQEADDVGTFLLLCSLYLVHNPYVMGDGSGKPDQLVAGWKVLEDLKDEGLLMSIGVSNFRPQDIQAILDKCEYRPTVNQLEFHPQLLAHLAPLIEIQRKNGIITEAYGGLQPLIKNQGSRLEPVVNEIAKRLSNESGKPVEPAIVLLLWCHAMDVVAVTTSSQEERIKAFAGKHYSKSFMQYRTC